MTKSIKYLLALCLTIVAFPAFAQQQQAKAILDKTAAQFTKSGGISASFTVKSMNGRRSAGSVSGNIKLKGQKFILDAAGMTTWFNGRTQWSYSKNNNEVTVSTPTVSELQEMNPYTFIYMYKKGFSYRLGSMKTYQGKSVYQVLLTATSGRSDLASVVLYIARNSYQPLSIQVRKRNGGSSTININHYRGGMKFADADFTFNKSRYSKAEIIDVR